MGCATYMGVMAHADNTAPSTGEAAEESAKVVKIHQDARSQFIAAGKRDAEEIYIASGRPEDRPTAIYSDDARFYSCLTKTESVKRGGDPAVWSEYRALQDFVTALGKTAATIDRVMSGEKIREALKG